MESLPYYMNIKAQVVDGKIQKIHYPTPYDEQWAEAYTLWVDYLYKATLALFTSDGKYPLGEEYKEHLDSFKLLHQPRFQSQDEQDSVEEERLVNYCLVFPASPNSSSTHMQDFYGDMYKSGSDEVFDRGSLTRQAFTQMLAYNPDLLPISPLPKAFQYEWKDEVWDLLVGSEIYQNTRNNKGPYQLSRLRLKPHRNLKK